MAAVWRQFVLANLHPSRWRGASYIYRLVGLLRPWRQESWLLRWSQLVGALLIGIILLVGPFVPTGFIGILLLASAGYWGLLTLADDGSAKATPIHLLVLLYWSIATVAIAFSPVKAAAISGWVELTLYLLMFALAARVMRSPRITTWLVTLYLLVALVVSVYGVRQQFFGAEQLATWNDPNSPLAQDTRVYSYLGNPNLLAGYLLGAIALSIAAVFVWRGWLPKALALLMVGINSACLYFTDSRGGWLGMLALLFTFLLLLRYWWNDYLPRFWRIWLLPLLFGSLAALLIGAVVLVEPLRLRVLSIFAGREDSSNNFRINVWAAVLDMIRDRPLIGIGPGNDAFNKVYPLYMRPRFTALGAYSIFLEIAVETGLIGLGCFLWLVVVTFDGAVRQLGRWRTTQYRQGYWMMAAIAAMVGILTQGIADTVWYRPQIHTLWWFMLALIASHSSTDDRASDIAKTQKA